MVVARARCLGACCPIVVTEVPTGLHWALGVVELEQTLHMLLVSPPGELHISVENILILNSHSCVCVCVCVRARVNFLQL
jgi:hypothetical protein